MKTKFKLLGIAQLMWGLSVSTAFAEKPSGKLPQASPPPTTGTEERGMLVDEATFQKIFEGTVSEATVDSSNRAAPYALEISGQYASLRDLTLSNSYFRVPYSDSISGMAGFQISIGRKFHTPANVQLTPLVNVGYSYTSELIKVESKQGSKLTDLLKLHSFPLSAGVRAAWPIPRLEVVSLVADASLGIGYFYQAGNLDGINQGFWVPLYSLGGGLSLFDQSMKSRDAWFGGVNLLVSSVSSFSSEQSSRSLKMSLGLKVNL